MQDLHRIFDLHHRSQQCWILNPLSEAGDGTHILMDTSRIRFLWAMAGTPVLLLLSYNVNCSYRYSIILASGVQHGYWIFLYIMKWSPLLGPVTICHHPQLLGYYWLHSLCVRYIPVTYLFYSWKFVPLNPLPLFHLSPTLLSWWPPICSLWVCFCFIYFLLYF